MRLDAFRAAGVLGPLEVSFARAMARRVGEDDLSVLLGAAMACRAPSHGHVCAELGRLAQTVRVELADGVAPPVLVWPDAEAWVEAMRGSALVRTPGDAASTPLLLDGDRLYLDRYWRYQQRLVVELRARAEVLERPPDPLALRRSLDALFGVPAVDEPLDRQKLAALMGVLRRLTVITGGPGTGKTTTVVRLLALLLETTGVKQVALLAPTGKAAARLGEAIREHAARPPLAGRGLALPDEASTIHRCLGYRPDHPTRFRHDADHPLPMDVVVVDEASMVDLALMAKLVQAVRSDARLILLGDQDQLASVEAGVVLADLCNAGQPWPGFSPRFARALASALGPLPDELVAPASAPAMADCVVQLTRSRRFDAASGVGEVARAINAGEAAVVVNRLSDASLTDVSRVETTAEGELPAPVRARIIAAYAKIGQARDPVDALAALNAFRVLCAQRRGRLGVNALNSTIERWLAERGTIAPVEAWYPGRPLMITRNDYTSSLFNGDIGVVLRDEEGAPRACFPRSDGPGIRALHPARLPPHETVYAMTVHKSQGSEFDEVVVVLPATRSRVVTRELLYTGVTRARTRVTVVGTSAVIAAAVRDPVQRASGLRAQVWSEPR